MIYTSATNDVDASGNRSWLIAVLLTLFLGVLGIDRFYLGYLLAGILKFYTSENSGFGRFSTLLPSFLAHLC